MNKKLITQALQATKMAISARSTLPILKNVLIQSTDDLTTFSATNLEIAIVYTVPGCLTDKPITLPIKEFFEIVKGTGDVTMTIDHVTAKLSDGTNLIGITADDFPSIAKPEGESYIIPPVYNIVGHAVSIEEHRPILQALNFHASDAGLTIAGTDGFRLSTVHFNILAGNFNLNIPAKTIQIAEKLGCNLLSIQPNNNHIIFEGNNCYIVSQLIDGNYPDYLPIFPKNYANTLTLNRIKLLETLKAAFNIAKNEINLIKLEIKDGALNISAKVESVGKFESSIPASGNMTTFGCNCKFLIQALESTNRETITIKSNAANSLIGIGLESNRNYIIMPMHLE